MSSYLQTSTANPYGHRPWATRLYTTFEDYAFLKQPQNKILREDMNMRPEIYRPPEMKSAAALGDMTIVGGSGRVLRRARRTMLGSLPMMIGNGGGPISRSQIIFRGPIANGGPVLPAPMPVWAPIVRPVYSGPMPGWNPGAAPPIQFLPPSIVPPPPQVVGSGPGGTVYALPGNATTPGSPFAPATPAQLPFPSGAVPISSAPDGLVAAAATPAVSAGSLSDWFNAQTLISGVSNGYIALGGAFAVYLFAKKKR